MICAVVSKRYEQEDQRLGLETVLKCSFSSPPPHQPILILVRPCPSRPARPLCSLHKEPLGLHSKQVVFCRLGICQGRNLHIPLLPSGDRMSKVTDLTLPKDAPRNFRRPTLGIFSPIKFFVLVLCVLPTCMCMYHVCVRSEDSLKSPGSGLTDGCELLLGC